MSLHAKMTAGAILLACGTAYLAYLGGSVSWQYYVLVDECMADSDHLTGCRLRVNGRVAPGSLKIRDDRMLATFALNGQQTTIQATCTGPLPDNLAEDMDVVVEGMLERRDFLRGDKVLTRCASKYEQDRKAT